MYDKIDNEPGNIDQHLEAIKWLFKPSFNDKNFIKWDNDIYQNPELMQFVINCVQDGISILDSSLNIINVNEYMKSWFPDKLPIVGEKCYKVYHERSTPCRNCPVLRTFSQKTLNTELVQYTRNKKHQGWHQLFAIPVFDKDENVIGVIEYARDISFVINLQHQIEQIKEQMDLMEKKNTALASLLEKKDLEKKQMEENISFNVDKIIKPSIKYLMKCISDKKNSQDVQFVESLLSEIDSPVSKKLPSDFSNFTPREIQIADLIKEGKSTKEIAEQLYISAKSVDFHRSNLRKKLGLKYGENNIGNLRTYLLMHF
jgi:hypothetical protein